MMNRVRIILLITAVLVFHQCGIQKEVIQPEAPKLVGVEGFRELCKSGDTIRNILISKAESLIITEEERYEATVTLFAVRDSIIYISAVSGGFEILRASVEPDTIRVIDRLNKIFYRSPVKRRFGHQHPVDFEDVNNIISSYFVCNDLNRAIEQDFSHIIFDFDEPLIKKRISFGRESLKMDKFEFYHIQTHKFFTGEKDEDGFRLYSNFIIGEFEIKARGGTILYNQDIPIKMEVNPRRYSFIDM